MMVKKFDLTGKTCLVTGAAGLLGTHHAEALLSLGATVVLTDISDSQLKIAKRQLIDKFDNDKILTVVMDVTKVDEINLCSSKLLSDGLRVDVLINNAAVDPKVSGNSVLGSTRLENFDLEQWNTQISVGLTGAFLCSKVFGSLMAQDGKGGVVLNIASDLSFIAPDQRIYRDVSLPDNMQPVKPVSYSVIKSGLVGLTRYLATYWADKGVRCNALSPGGIRNDQNEGFVERLSNLIPLGRMADKDEFQAAIQFLCSDASSYMTGQNILMDGGRSAW